MAVADALMRSPDFERRWTDFLIDDLRVQRGGASPQEACFATPMRSRSGPELAAFIRDHDPLQPAPGGPFNMADVLRSSLALDDLTPLFRAQLFPTMTRPLVHCNNLSDLENDLSRRRAFGATFADVMLHRTITCAECHNADISPTMTHDPATNRYWPVSGEFERALWGDKKGRPPEEFYAMFRHMGVVSRDDRGSEVKPDPREVQPWSMDPVCGSFLPPSAFPDDPSGIQAFFGGPHGLHGSIWDVEAQLNEGLHALRAGAEPFPPNDTSMTGAFALGSLLSQSIVQDVWAEVFGTSLTIAHGVPRNQAERDLLVSLTRTFVSSRWSLRRLLRELVLHPLFNQRAVSEACGRSPYALPAVLNPWSYDDPVPERRANSAADGILRMNARAMLNATATALRWAPEPSFPSIDEQRFQSSVGAWISKADQGSPDPDFEGLLALEDRYGTCSPPRSIRHDPADDSRPVTSCSGRCDHAATAEHYGKSCACDAACTALGDCCGDFAPLCVDGLPPPPPDWIDQLLDVARRWPKTHAGKSVTLRDLILAVRDRLWADPHLDEVDERLLRDYFATDTLERPLPEVPMAVADQLRLYCGVLLKSPQFQLLGIPLPSAPTVAPRLVVEGDGYQDLCRSWASAVREATSRTVDCSGGSLKLSQRHR
jgi:hypothetical protein